MGHAQRACLSCRLSKSKCDLVRPACGRCARRGTLCEGYQVAGSFVFKDETAHAESLSRRSRRSSKEISSSRPEQTTSVHNQSSTNPKRGGLYYPWLSEQARANIPSHIKRSSETIAVEHFFANWIAAPNDSSPGHMHHLPLLYESASRGSVLTLSVRAVAFADLARLAIDGREYTIEGLKSYGAALVSLRKAVQDTTSLDHDQILSALLLVDEFETLYMGNDLPLGLHGKAVDYVLAARGTHQLYSPRSFSLARAALFRLQARQLLLGEDCTEIQRMLINSLNLDVADLRMLDHISQITHLCAKLKHLESGWFETSRGDVIENAARLLEDFDGLAVSIDEWTSAVDAELKPTILSSQVATWIQHVSTSNEENPMRAFQCPRMEWHRDTVVTFLWSFYAAAQLVLRDRVLRILNLTLQVSPTTTPLQQGRVEAETIKIDMLSASIIRLFPALMGFNSASSTGLSPQRKPSQINSLGRFLGIFAMLVIKHVPTTPESHKLCVERVLKWMRTYDQLNGTQRVSY